MSEEEDNKQMTKRFYEDVVNGGQLDLIDKMVAEDFVDHEAPPGQEPPVRGRDVTRTVVEGMREAFPDLEVEVQQVVAEGDLVTARTTWRGTHEGSFFGIDPSNESVEVESIDIVRVEDGVVTEHWGLMDNVALLSQIGEIQPPGMEPR